MNCPLCRKDVTALSKLAEHTKGDPRVGRVDCSGEGKKVCSAFGVGFKAPIPATIFVSEDKGVYKYA